MRPEGGRIPARCGPVTSIAVGLVMAWLAIGRVAAAAEVRVERTSDGSHTLLREGRPFVIRGAGGVDHLDVLAACGGNSIRTWSAESAEKPGHDAKGRSLLDRAHALGITVTVGLWLAHERHGFDYSDESAVARQREEVLAAVRRLSGHPAVLLWGLGNEMEGPEGVGDDPRVWREVGRLAALVKQADPSHPVMTVVANVNERKLAAIREHAPAIDILGVNAYSGSAGVAARLRRAGWEKPHCITEFGLPGPWEVGQTAWHAPIEPSSREKAGLSYVACRSMMEGAGCLGGYVFLWGQKQEATRSWFGMFLESGEKTPRVDAMARAWTGRWPADRAPVLEEADVPLASARLPPGTAVPVRVRYRDPEGEPLAFTWSVARESTDRRVGGDAEQRPEDVAGAVESVRGEPDGTATAVVRIPSRPGGYRLFVTVRDGRGSAAIDNWPFASGGP
jgi:hypothetical protein